MKKFLTLSAVSMALSASLFATSLDEKTITINFEGYKTPTMIGTKGNFTKANFKLNKDNSTLAKQLSNASVTLSPKDIDMGGEVNQIITDNVINVFFKELNAKKNIKVVLESVTEGENTGLISARVSIGKQSTLVPLVYSIKEGEFKAEGKLDLLVFANAPKALKALSDVAPGHLGVSWSLVDILVNAKVK